MQRVIAVLIAAAVAAACFGFGAVSVNSMEGGTIYNVDIWFNNVYKSTT